MKRSITILLFMALPCWLSAQSTIPLFKLQQGAWFDYLVTVDADLRIPGATDPLAFVNLLGDKFRNQYTIRYRLKKQLPNGNQQFDVTVERVSYRLRSDDRPTWMGYDSFYPVYLQGRKESDARIAYSVDVLPDGRINSVIPATPDVTVDLQEISPKKMSGSYSMMKVEPLPLEVFKFFNELITVPLRTASVKKISAPGGTVVSLSVTGSADQRFISMNGQILAVPVTPQHLPGRIAFPGLSILLVDGSFTIPANALVTGKITGDVRTNTTIYVFNKKVTLASDGSFSCPLLLKNPSESNLRTGKSEANLFMKPGDTLTVSANAADISSSIVFSGPAAADSKLANAILKDFEAMDPNNSSNLFKSDGAEALSRHEASTNNQFQRKLESFAASASLTAINYYKTEWAFLLGEARLYALYQSNYKYNAKSTASFQGFPADYFFSIDTMSILMNDHIDGRHYENYFEWYLPFQLARISMSGGGQYNFLSTYSIALASLKAAPLYLVLADNMEEELAKNSWLENQRIRNFYEDFITNCRDTVLTNRVTRLWKASERWMPGNAGPVKTLTLADGSVFDLEKFQGKPLCLIASFNDPGELAGYLQLIKSYKPGEMQFVIVQSKQPPFDKGQPDSAFLKLPNTVYVEVAGYREMQQLGVGMFETKVFIFDKWFRVIENNLSPPMGGESLLNAPLRKAIDAKRFSKEQKAEMIKLGGWSLGSALAVVIGGMLIYRRRVRRLKEREAIKRTIKELEIKAIRSQMNPHFVFNALNSIQSLITSGQPKQAVIYLAKFATLLRSVLANSEKGTVHLSDELESVTLYCQLEQLRFNFAFSMVVDDSVNPSLLQIPGMIIQPLAENAVVHGLATKKDAGILSIRVSSVDGLLQVKVTDNGAKLKLEDEDLLSKTGFGLKLVRQRLAILSGDNKNAHLSVKSEIVNQEPQTTALLRIPID